MENTMKYDNNNTEKSKIDKLIKLFNELIIEFNNISKNSFVEISTNKHLARVCDQINLLKNNIFISLNKISKKNEIENIFKKLIENSTKKEKDFLVDAFENFTSTDNNTIFKSKFFTELTNYYELLISKKKNLLNVINSFSESDDKSLLLDFNSEMKILESNIVKFQESNKHLYFNLSKDEKALLQKQTKSIADLNSYIYTYFSKLKNNNYELQDDINLYMDKLKKINDLYISLKSKFNEMMNNKEFFLNLKFKKNLPISEKYEIIDSKVNQIKWEYNFKLFEIKSSFDLSNNVNHTSQNNNSIDQIKLKIKDIEDMIYSLLNEKTDYLKTQLKQFLITNKYQDEKNFSFNNDTTKEEILEKKVTLLENQLLYNWDKINNENTTFLSNVENKLNNLATTDKSEKIENTILNFSNEFKDVIFNLSKEIIDLKEKFYNNDSKPNIDIDMLSKKIDNTLDNIYAANTLKNFSFDEFINIFNINLRKSLEETLDRIATSYKEHSLVFYSEISKDSQKYKDDIINQVTEIVSKNLEKSNFLVDKLSNKVLDFKNDQKLFVKENNKIIFSILKKNENEKDAIKNLLKKISDRNDEISDEAQINKLFFHNSKLMELDALIKNQNDSFLNFLNDKEQMYFEVEKILLNKNKTEKSMDKLERIESEIQKIHTVINSKIESVEKSFIERFDFINKEYLDEIKVTNKIFANDFEIAIFEHINNTENKLLNNFSDIKANILSVVSQVNGELELIKTTPLSLPELDEKLAMLASKIDEIKTIEQEESVTKLNFQEIKSMLDNASFSLEEKISQINLLQDDISRNISSELHSALDKNAGYFLSDIKKTLNENTNETILSIDNRLAMISEEEKNLPEKISNELFSILDKNNERFLSGLNKSLEINKTQTIDISNKIYDEFNKFRNDQLDFIEGNKNWFKIIIQHNENNKFYIKKLLDQLNNKNDELATELQASKLTFHNNKLFELEGLIAKQTSEVSSLIQEKTELYGEIERILTSKKSKENNEEKLYRIESEISNINSNFESKFKYLQENLIDKFDFINKDYLDDIKVTNKISANDFEIAIFEHISNTENTLLNNFSDIKANILSVVSQVNGEIDLIKAIPLSSSELDEKLAMLASKIDEIKTIEQEESVTKLNFQEIKSMLDNASFSLEEKISQINLLQDDISRNISSELHSALDKNAGYFLSDIKKTLNENTNETILSIDNRLAMISEEEKNLPEKISNELFSILDKNNEKFLSGLNKSLEINKTQTIDISNKIYEEFNKFRNDQSDFIEGNKNWFKIIIQNNENNKFYIKKLLDQLNNKNDELAIELQASKLAFHNNKLFELEGLIAKQTTDVSSLIQEKTEIYDEIERILTSKKSKENNEEKLYRIESEISNINSNFESKFKYLQENLIDKFDLLNKQYIQEIEFDSSDTDVTLSKEIFNNINTIENKLLENFDSVQLNIATSIKSISDQVELLRNNHLPEPEIEKKLILLVDNIKNLKKIDQLNLPKNTKDSINLDELNSDYKKIANDLYEQISHSVTADNKEIFDKINQEFVKINNEFNKSKSDSKYFVNKIYDEINKFKREQKQLILKNKDWFQSMINSNNIEKKQINELLKEMDTNKKDSINEFGIYKWNIYVDELSKLEELIILQNNSLISLIEEKEIIYGEIQNVLVTKKEDEVHADKLKRICIEIDDISSKFLLKIKTLKEEFEVKFSSIEARINEEILDLNDKNELENKMERLFAKMENIKGKLFYNFDLINDNIASTIFNINNQIKNVIKTSIVEKEIENKLFHLAQQIEDIKVFELSNILSELNIDNKFHTKNPNENNFISTNDFDLLKAYDIDSRESKNTNELISDKLKNILFIYDINKIEDIIKISDFFHEFENKKSMLLELFNNSLNNVNSINNNLLNRLSSLDNNKSTYLKGNEDFFSIISSKEINDQIRKLIDKHNIKVISISLDRHLILEKIEKLILLKKSNYYVEQDLSSNLLQLKESSKIKINHLIDDLSRQFNIIKANIAIDNSDLNKVDYIEKILLTNLADIKNIWINDLNESEINIISLRKYLDSFQKSNETDATYIEKPKKMSNNNNYDLKLIDNITMENIILLENKRKEIKNFYRKLRDLGNKH